MHRLGLTIGVMISVAFFLHCESRHLETTKYVFSRYYIDEDYGGTGRPGWVRAGDMDGDGDLDIVAGGGGALFIYENDGSARTWTRYGNLDSTGQSGANGAVLHDVDTDGDLDIVSAKYYGDLGWWENPGGTIRHSLWNFHGFACAEWFLHDMVCADLDQDGIDEEFLVNLNKHYWKADLKIEWFRPGATPQELWEEHTIEYGRNEGEPHAHAGLDVGDVDGDGHVDLAYGNGWYEAPDDPTGIWVWHQVTDAYGISNTLLRDVDRDGDLDLIMAAGHHGTGVFWFSAPIDPKTGTWSSNVIDDKLLHPEGLGAVDLDADGDLDIITCDIDFDRWKHQVHNVYLFENSRNGICWVKHRISSNSYPSHQLQLVDINNDGGMDVISEAAGHSVVTYYENSASCGDDMK